MTGEREEGNMVANETTQDIVTATEIDKQIATARAYPRSVKHFLDEARQMVTLTEKIAGDCIYAIPRGGKVIEGPSARFAEVIANAWGNMRAGARVVREDAEFVTAQGVSHDLEKNVAITYEVKRRIVDKYGKRFKPDMIGVTANAACSIALRNSILKAVPKAFWSELYDSARQTAMGDAKTLATRRADALAHMLGLGASEDVVCNVLEVAGVEDITLEHLVTLRGIATAIKDGDTTVEQAFNIGGVQIKTKKNTEDLKKKLASKQEDNVNSEKKEADKPKDGASPAQIKKIQAVMSEMGLKTEAEQLDWIGSNFEIQIPEVDGLSKDQANKIIKAIEKKAGS
ncbi:hypothetical protein KAR91_83970 [Candidatus Pacearchaeota archaeon]|nr:hypothetical protein [Candidatus Pacearchaeota archaeon]